jgi:hypothetical protein
MRKALRDLADVREELVQVEEEFTRLQQRIEAVRDSVADSLARLFGEERPGFTALREEALIERIADNVVARLDTSPKAQARGETRYVRDIEAAAFLGVSVFTLRSWRSRGKPSGPPFAKIGSMVMYSVKELEQFIEQRGCPYTDQTSDRYGRAGVRFRSSKTVATMLS